MAEKHVNTIETSPQAEQSINHEDKEYTTIKEGLAYILVPHGIPTSTNPKMSKEEHQKQQVFYNPIQQFNRDLSVLAIKAFGDDLVYQKTQKHERAVQKAHRRKQRQKENAAEDDGLGHAEMVDESSKKRKLQKGHIADGVEISFKKTKLTDDAGDFQMSGAELSSVPAVGEAANGRGAKTDQIYKPPFRILDALSATGLRALRYATEIPATTSITANDMSPKATDSIRLNIKHNKLESKIQANTGNAIAYMYGFVDKRGFDVIDLDPYGTAAPFLDAAIQALEDDGLLCVTCTDSAIFASHGYLEKTYSQYGGLPFKGDACHEGGIRLVLNAVASSAARYGRAIEPLLSLSIDYYIRCFIRIRKSPADVKFLAGKTMIVYHCDNGCGSWSTQFLARHKPEHNKANTYKHTFAQGPSANEFCEHCGTKTHLSGPMYGGPLHNVGFIERVLAQLQGLDRETYQTTDRIEGMLRTALEEITLGEKTEGDTKAFAHTKLSPLIPKTDPAELDHHPFFFLPSQVAKAIHCQAPSTAQLRGALRVAGFQATMSHCKPGSIRTNAPWRAIWHIMLEYVRQVAPLKNRLKLRTPGHTIMSKVPELRKFVEEEEDSKGGVATSAPTEQTNTLIDFSENVNSSIETNTTRKSDALKKEESEVATPAYLGVDFKVAFDEKIGKDYDKGKYVRYQLAPRENWGPMSRAK